MRRLVILAATATFASIMAGATPASAQTQRIMLRAELSGSSETPPVLTGSFGY